MYGRGTVGGARRTSCKHGSIEKKMAERQKRRNTTPMTYRFLTTKARFE